MEHFEKKITLEPWICPRLMIPKKLVTRMSLDSCFRKLFGNQAVKGSKTLLKSGRQHFFANVPLISNKLSCGSCLLVGSEFLGPLFNTFTGDQVYSCYNWQKVWQKVRTQLSSKPSSFPGYFIAFSKST